MLIGPTFTLSEFEEKLEERLLENRKRDQDLMNEFKSLQQKIAVLPRLVADEDTGNKIANKEYLDAYNRSSQVQQDMNDLIEQNDFIKQKLEELENYGPYENRSISKDREKITLTLRDCIYFGIEIPGEE